MLHSLLSPYILSQLLPFRNCSLFITLSVRKCVHKLHNKGGESFWYLLKYVEKVEKMDDKHLIQKEKGSNKEWTWKIILEIKEMPLDIFLYACNMDSLKDFFVKHNANEIDLGLKYFILTAIAKTLSVFYWTLQALRYAIVNR